MPRAVVALVHHPGTTAQQRNKRRSAVVVGLLACILALPSCDIVKSGTLPPVPLAHVDLDRMYGGWYMVATMRNDMEKGTLAPFDVYSKRPDGDIREDFYERHGTFAAPVKHHVVHDWVRPGTDNAHWRVQIVWPINLPFLVLYTDPDYRYVLFGENNRRFGWIYSRTQTLPDVDYQQLLDRFEALGYDRSQFVKFIQLPEQIGQPGYWNDGIAP